MKKMLKLVISGLLIYLHPFFSPVSANACTRANPTAQTDMVRISSSHETFDHLPNFYATIRNDDTPDCGLSTFAIVVNAPSEWDQSIIPDTIDLMPGESKRVNLFLKPSAETKRGTYAILLIINNWTARFSPPWKQITVNYSFEVTDDPKPGPTKTPGVLQPRNMKYNNQVTDTPLPHVYLSPTQKPTPTAPVQSGGITKINQFSIRALWNTFLQFLQSFSSK